MRGSLPFYKILLFVIVIAPILNGCGTKDDPLLVPSYLYIDNIDLQTQYEQGTASHKITDAWVYIDEKLIGAFEMPATVPILIDGKQKVTVRPGIKINGISKSRTIYPYFNPMVREMILVRDSTIHFGNARTTYRQNVKFPWLEGFETGNFSLDTTRKSTVNIQRTNDPNLRFSLPDESSEYSAHIHLDSDSALFEAASRESYDFPAAGSEVFLEMNYKTENSLVVGVFYLSSGMQVQRPLIILNKSDVWNKVYVNLTVPKYDTPNATDFRIFFGAQTDEGLNQADIYLDNLKLIHF